MCELILYSPEKRKKKQTHKRKKLKSAKFLYIQFIYIISYQIIYIFHLYHSSFFMIRFESTSP